MRSEGRVSQGVTLFFTLTGFILFLLVVLSVPTISSISFTSLSTTITATTYDTGVFGVCYRTGLNASISLPSSGVANPANPDPYITNMCPQLGVGWWSRFTPQYANVPSTVIASRAFTRALVVNVLAVAFSGVGLVVAAISAVTGWTDGPKASSIVLLFSTVLGWIAFGIDIAFSVQVRNRLSALDDTVRVRLGNANWMALGGSIALLIAFITAELAFRRVAAQRQRDTMAERELKQTDTTTSSARTSNV